MLELGGDFALRVGAGRWVGQWAIFGEEMAMVLSRMDNERLTLGGGGDGDGGDDAALLAAGAAVG